MKCPICGNEMVNTYRDMLDGWCLMEEEYECPSKHYRYFYATGYTSIFVGKTESLSYGYDSPPTKLAEILHKIRILIYRQRERKSNGTNHH